MNIDKMRKKLKKMNIDEMEQKIIDLENEKNLMLQVMGEMEAVEAGQSPINAKPYKMI